MNKLLWLVAPQIDYGPGGAVEIPDANTHWQNWLKLTEDYDAVWCSLEHHPADHVSFASVHPWRKPGAKILYQGKELELMITHCVAEGFGAMVCPAFSHYAFDELIYFGQRREEEPQLIFPVELLDKLDLKKFGQIDVLGFNHSSIIPMSVKRLRDSGFPAKILGAHSAWPDKEESLKNIFDNKIDEILI